MPNFESWSLTLRFLVISYALVTAGAFLPLRKDSMRLRDRRILRHVVESSVVNPQAWENFRPKRPGPARPEKIPDCNGPARPENHTPGFTTLVESVKDRAMISIIN